MTMGAACHSATCATIQMTVVTTVMSKAAPSPHVTLLLSSAVLTGAASVQLLSVMATMTVETTPLLMKSIAVSDDQDDRGFSFSSVDAMFGFSLCEYPAAVTCSCYLE